jgi:ubiquinone/menaquinone biosynthesis C-methylase UbiE
MAQDHFLDPPMADIIEHWRYYLRALAPAADHRILDVGCHNGDAERLLLREYPHIAKVIGIDLKPKKLAEALANWERDGRQLPFPDGHFDRVLCAETLEYIDDPALALREMRRVLRPGGLALLIHTDYDTQVFNAGDKDLCRRLVAAFSDSGPNGQMGRALYPLCAAAGFAQVQPDVYPLVNTEWRPDRYAYRVAHMMVDWLRLEHSATDADLARWLADLEDQAGRGAFYYSINRYLCVCRK